MCVRVRVCVLTFALELGITRNEQFAEIERVEVIHMQHIIIIRAAEV